MPINITIPTNIAGLNADLRVAIQPSFQDDGSIQSISLNYRTDWEDVKVAKNTLTDQGPNKRGLSDAGVTSLTNVGGQINAIVDALKNIGFDVTRNPISCDDPLDYYSGGYNASAKIVAKTITLEQVQTALQQVVDKFPGAMLKEEPEQGEGKLDMATDYQLNAGRIAKLKHQAVQEAREKLKSKPNHPRPAFRPEDPRLEHPDKRRAFSAKVNRRTDIIR